MSYRPPSHPPETAWARHLDQVMRERDWSRVRLFEEVGAELGYRPKSRSALLPLLIDKEPSKVRADVLRRHFGNPPARIEPMPEPEPTLASALNALVTEVREARQWREALEARLVAVEGELRSLRDQRGGAGQPARSVPGGRAG